jgi:hypothetical protein
MGVWVYLDMMRLGRKLRELSRKIDRLSWMFMKRFVIDTVPGVKGAGWRW